MNQIPSIKPGDQGDRLNPTSDALDQIPAVSVEGLLASLSQALDLAEGRRKGHALRVCYIASWLARELTLPRQQRSAAFFAALLHDAGVAHASGAVSNLPRIHEQEIFAASPLQTPATIAARIGGSHAATLTEAFHDHAFEGASAAAGLGMPPQVAEGILCHHERHDGAGYPLGFSGDEVPMVARIVAAADHAEAIVAADPNPLATRRYLQAGLREQAGRALHPDVVEAFLAVSRRDEFWLGLHNQALLSLLVDVGDPEPRPMTPAAVLQMTAAFADIADAKHFYRRGHSRRVARQSRTLAIALGLGPGHAQAVELAALVHDIGMLRVPHRIIGKPEILTVPEMTVLRDHPLESAAILGTVPGWGAMAGWVAGHHERLDGRGYPDATTGADIPFEARILATADIYEALIADRPHRAALTTPEALRAMGQMVGQNLDPAVFATFEGVVTGTGDGEAAGS